MQAPIEIAKVELHRVALPMRHAFEHAQSSRETSEVVLVCVLDEHGRRGWGEALPRPYVTGETLDDVLQRHGPALARALVGVRIGGWDDATAWLDAQAAACGRAMATLCAFDLALLDLVGQVRDASVAQVLGGMQYPSLPAGAIIGFERPTQQLGRYCAALRFGGKRHIKVKVGRDDDEARLREIAKVFKGVPLRLDANGVWQADEAVERLERLVRVAAIDSIEQPTPPGDLDALARVRERGPVRVMADESVCSLADAQALIERRAADIFNIRLGKNGGLWAARRLVARAGEAGIDVHLGTMVGETGILSRAAVLFGRCVPGFACLDGKGQNAFLLEADVVHPDADIEAGPKCPGLGVRVDLERVLERQVVPPEVHDS